MGFFLKNILSKALKENESEVSILKDKNIKNEEVITTVILRLFIARHVVSSASPVHRIFCPMPNLYGPPC